MKVSEKFYIDSACVMYVTNRCIYLCCKYLYERGRGSTDARFDKVLSIRDGKVDPLLHRIHVGLPFVARSRSFFEEVSQFKSD